MKPGSYILFMVNQKKRKTKKRNPKCREFFIQRGAVQRCQTVPRDPNGRVFRAEVFFL